MNKKQLIATFLIVFISFASFESTAVDKYISDRLPIYLKRVPDVRSGLIGTLKSGDKVSVLAVSDDGKFTQIKDERNRIAWIETEYLSDSKSLKEQVNDLEQQILLYKKKEDNFLQDKQNAIEEYAAQLTIANEKITELEKSNQELQTQTEQQSKAIDVYSVQLDEKKQDLMLKWFTRGGIVVIAALLLGLILPLIIPRRRKKDRWM